MSPRAIVAFRLLSFLVRLSLYMVGVLAAVTPVILGAFFLLLRLRAPEWMIFVLMSGLAIAGFFLGQPLADRLINEHDFRCAGCGQAAARFGWVGPARSNQSFEFRCRRCGRSDVNTVIGTVISLLRA